MKKSNILCAVCLALALMACITAISVSAKSLDPVTFASDYVTSVKYIVTHPKEFVEITDAFVGRKQSDNVDEILENSQDAQTFLRLINISNTIGRNGKAAIATINPSNTERNRILSINVDHPKDKPVGTDTHSAFNPEINFLSTPYFYKNTINIDPMIVYKNRNHQLVVIGILMNYSDRNLEVRGIPYIQLSENGKIIASGNSANFETPMRLSYYQEKVNSGVYDGLPTQCFVIMTFEPGTYDGTVDISELNNLECNYSLDYSYLS